MHIEYLQTHRGIPTCQRIELKSSHEGVELGSDVRFEQIQLEIFGIGAGMIVDGIDKLIKDFKLSPEFKTQL